MKKVLFLFTLLVVAGIAKAEIEGPQPMGPDKNVRGNIKFPGYDKKGVTKVSQDLHYTIQTYDSSNYKHQNDPIHVDRLMIQACN